MLEASAIQDYQIDVYSIIGYHVFNTIKIIWKHDVNNMFIKYKNVIMILQ